MSLLACLALGWLAAAGGAQEPPAPGLDAPDQDPAARRAWLEQLAAARGVPAEPPRRLAQHYDFEGTISFHFEGREPITQQAELSVGGPGRMRYVLIAGQLKNVFLLQSPEQAWFRTGGEDFEAYDAGEVALQNWMRWTVCRFPWDRAADLAQCAPGSREICLDGPYGACQLELGPDLRPLRLRHGRATLELSDWRQLGDGSWLPERWQWQLEAVRQVERFPRLENQVLFFDRTFAPRPDTPIELQWTAEADADQVRLGVDSIEVVQRPAVRALRGPADGAWHAALLESGAVSPVLYEWLDEEGAVLATAAALTGPWPESLPEGVERAPQPAGLFLRWLSYAPDPDHQANAAALRAGAAKGKLEIRGPVWHRRRTGDGPQRAELLLPVKG